MIEVQEINFPDNCVVINHDFHTYDPLNSYTESDNLDYLHEDLLQCKFPEDDILIDLGWYGNIADNKGEFQIQIIKNENWEMPLNTSYSKSVIEIKEILDKILLYYSNTINNDIS